MTMGYIQLRNYAEWYYTKYFPSKRMLQEKLFGRGEEEEVVHRVMSDLESLIVEDKIIESRIHAYISSGKTERYIRTKLRQKKFDTELIEKLLTEREGILHDPETYRPQIERAVQKWVQKWISKKALQYELSIKYPDARDVITELLVDYDDKTILQEKAPELLRKYSQEQFVWKLSQKGFQISDIYAALRRR
jgi:SOS response regulatory protein OraA/RecX